MPAPGSKVSKTKKKRDLFIKPVYSTKETYEYITNTDYDYYDTDYYD